MGIKLGKTYLGNELRTGNDEAQEEEKKKKEDLRGEIIEGTRSQKDRSPESRNKGDRREKIKTFLRQSAE